MPAFLFVVNRTNMNYGEEVKLTESGKLLHSYKVLGEWPSAREQLHLGQIYNSKHGIHLWDNYWKNQHCSALNVYERLGAKSGEILENILEWEGSFDKFSNETAERLPIFPSSILDTIEKELIRSAKSHHALNKHRYIMDFWINLSDMAGIQD